MGYFTTFFAGLIVGLYVEQNYRMPSIKKLIKVGIQKANEIEEDYKKSK
jgi:Domain of unknown function (DUF4535)